MTWTSTLKKLWWISLHLLVIVMLATSNFLVKLDDKFSLGLFSKLEFPPFYYEMVSYHLHVDANVESGSIIFIGDSHTQGLNTAAVSGQGINYGIGGDTTLGVIQRIPHYRSLRQAKSIVLEIGFNDLLRRSDTDILKGYEQILKLLPTQVPLIVCAVFPVDGNAFPPGINKRIRSLNVAAKAAFSKRPHSAFIDIGDQLVDVNGNLKVENHTGDGIHLNGAGNVIWINALKQALSQLGT